MDVAVIVRLCELRFTRWNLQDVLQLWRATRYVAAPRQRKMKLIQVDTNISIQGQQFKLITFVFSARMNWVPFVCYICSFINAQGDLCVLKSHLTDAQWWLFMVVINTEILFPGIEGDRWFTEKGNDQGAKPFRWLINYFSM